MKLAVGDTGSAKFVLSSRDGIEIPVSNVSLNVSSKRTSVAAVVRVENRIIVTAVSPGVAVIEVRAGEVQPGRLRVEVVEARTAVPRGSSSGVPAVHGSTGIVGPPSVAVVALRIPAAELRLAVGERDRIRAEALDATGAVVANAPIRFQLFSANVIALDSVSGTVTGQSPGQAFIGVSAPGAPGQSVSVTVEASTFRVDPDPLLILPAQRDTLRLVVPGLGRAYRGPVTWTSTNPSVAIVDPSSGAVTAVGTAGGPVSTVGIRAAAGGRDTYGSVAVLQPPPQSGGGLLFSVGPKPGVELMLPIGDGRDLRGVAVDAQQDTMYQLPVRWALTTGSGAVSLDAATGRLTAKRQGTDTLIARLLVRFDIQEFRWPLRVVEGEISFRRSRLGLRVGQLDSFPVVLLDSMQAPTDGRVAVEWATQPTSVLLHRGGGLVEGMGPGRAEVFARTAWDSVARATVLVPPDLVYSHAAKTAEGRRYAELRGVSLGTGATISLTGTSAIDDQAAVSPDRTRVAFVRQAGSGEQGIWLMDVDGRNQVSVTPDAAREKGPFWSADGRALFYIVTVVGQGDRLFVADADGQNPRSFLRDSFPVVSGAVSPDGRFLVYSTPRGGQYDLYRVPLSTTGPLMPIGGEAPLWVLPKHDMLQPQYAQSSGDLLFIQRERGGKSSQVLMRLPAHAREPQVVSPAGLQILSFAVAPDGQQIVAVALMPGGSAREQRTALYLLDARQIGSAIPPPWRQETGVTFATPTFTP